MNKIPMSKSDYLLSFKISALNASSVHAKMQRQAPIREFEDQRMHKERMK